MTNVQDIFGFANTLAVNLKQAKLLKRENDAKRDILQRLMQEAGLRELDISEGFFKIGLVKASLSQARLIQAGAQYNIDRRLMDEIINASFAFKSPSENLTFWGK